MWVFIIQLCQFDPKRSQMPFSKSLTHFSKLKNRDRIRFYLIWITITTTKCRPVFCFAFVFCVILHKYYTQRAKLPLGVHQIMLSFEQVIAIFYGFFSRIREWKINDELQNKSINLINSLVLYYQWYFPSLGLTDKAFQLAEAFSVFMLRCYSHQPLLSQRHKGAKLF